MIVRQQLPRISLSTVYRTLLLLSEQGTIRRLTAGDGETRFDGDISPHHHVRCLRCGRCEDAHELPERLLRRNYEWINGFRITQQQVDFAGICPDCQGVENQGGV